MPQQVRGPFPADPGIPQGTARDARHRRPGQRPVRRVKRQEHLTGPGPGRPAVAQVTGQRPADVGRQGNLVSAVPLAPHGHGPLPPGDVVQQQRGGLRSPQRQPQQQRDHRLVPDPARAGPHEREELSGLPGTEPSRRIRPGRGRERPDRPRKRDSGQALQPQEPEQRPHGAGPDLRRPRAQPGAGARPRSPASHSPNRASSTPAGSAGTTASSGGTTPSPRRYPSSGPRARPDRRNDRPRAAMYSSATSLPSPDSGTCPASSHRARCRSSATCAPQVRGEYPSRPSSATNPSAYCSSPDLPSADARRSMTISSPRQRNEKSITHTAVMPHYAAKGPP